MNAAHMMTIFTPTRRLLNHFIAFLLIKKVYDTSLADNYPGKD